MDREAVEGLKRSFRELCRSQVSGCRGVWAAHSRVPGPRVGITIMTHGNEPSGLAVYQYLRHKWKLEERLLRGSVYFILNNIAAAGRYLAIATSDDEVEKRKTRFVDLNMNRLPEDVYQRQGDQRYEVLRTRELGYAWDRLDYGLDIHSTSQDTPPMVIALARSDKRMVVRFPIEIVISNIDAVQQGKPASYFYGSQTAQVYGIEAGAHENESSFHMATVCTLSFLSALGFLPPGEMAEPVSQTEYRIFDSLLFPDGSYQLAKVFADFEPVSRGQVLAVGDGGPLSADRDCFVLMGPKTVKPTTIAEEVLFFADKLSVG